jgi:serine protease Do
MVQDVTPRSPAERAGLRAYDVIVEVEGTKVASNQELIQNISARQPGTVAKLEVVREGRRQSMSVKLAERPSRDEAEAQNGGDDSARPVRPAEAPTPPLGVTVRELDRAFRVGRQDIPDNIEGVIVARVDATGAARQVLRRGLVILEVNRKPTPSVAAYQRIVEAAKPGDVLAIYYYDPAVPGRSLVTVVVD